VVLASIPGALARARLLRWVSLGLQSSPKGILRAVVKRQRAVAEDLEMSPVHRLLR